MIDYSLIILSNTESEATFKMNLEFLTTFVESVNNKIFTYKILLIERNKEVDWGCEIDNLKIITPSNDFNFHKFLNFGIKHTKGDHYILSNSDVVFDKNWLTEVKKVSNQNQDIKPFSPYDASSNKLPLKSTNIEDFVLGHKNKLGRYSIYEYI